MRKIHSAEMFADHFGSATDCRAQRHPLLHGRESLDGQFTRKISSAGDVDAPVHSALSQTARYNQGPRCHIGADFDGCFGPQGVGVVYLNDWCRAVQVKLLAVTGQGEALRRPVVLYAFHNLSRSHIEDPKLPAPVSHVAVVGHRIAGLLIRTELQPAHTAGGWPDGGEVERPLIQVEFPDAEDRTPYHGVRRVEDTRDRSRRLARIVA